MGGNFQQNSMTLYRCACQREFGWKPRSGGHGGQDVAQPPEKYAVADDL